MEEEVEENEEKEEKEEDRIVYGGGKNRRGEETRSRGQRGDRESLFEATGRGGRGGGADGGGGQAPWVIPCPSAR